MSKKSKRKTTSFKSAVLLLLLMAILLITSSYAWFTANQTVTVSTLTVNVASSNGLQISTNAATWKTVISNEDITTNAYSANTNQVPTIMVPVSTVGETDSATGFMKMYKGSVEADATTGNFMLTATQSTETATTTSGDFIAFDLFLKVDTESPIYLTSASNVTANGTDSGLKNASRVAFVIEGNVPTGSDATGLKAASDVYIWEPNYDSHNAAGIANANDPYGLTVADSDSQKVAYYGIKQAFSTGVELSDTTNCSLVTPALYTKATTEAPAKSLFTLKAGITKVRVYMWVEGQDVDCENTASGANINFDLQFSLKAS